MRFAVICAVLISLGLAVLPSRAMAQSSDSATCGYLGVAVMPVNDLVATSLGMTDTRGALIHDVQDGSPAAKAGLKPGDVVLQFDRTTVTESTDFGSLVCQTRPNHKAHLTVLRHGAVIHMTTVLGSRANPAKFEPVARIALPPDGFTIPDMPTPALRWQCRRAGIEYESIDSQLAEFFGVKQGVLVRFVLPHSAADRAGLKAGDVLTRFSGKDLDDARELASLLERGGLPKDVPVELVRDHKRRTLSLPFASPAMMP